MSFRKYAIGVEVDNNGSYEVFDVIMLPFNDDEFFHRWNNGMSSGSAKVIYVSGVSSIYVNDIYENGVFSRGENSGKEIIISPGRDTFAFLSNNAVFGSMSFESGSFGAQKYMAASSENMMAFDITNLPDVNLGYVWNGSEFIQPE